MRRKQGTCIGLVLCVLLCLCAGCAPSGKEETYTLLWTTDPQWYSFEYPEILTHQNDWVVQNAKEQDIRYIFHTGDFVDNPHSTEQWSFVSAEYEKWDEAGLAYGALAGNHDVDGSDHSDFSKYFGRSRFEDNEWYGDDYQDNFGHYDLMTIGDTPFVFVYLGYNDDYTDEDYAWLNEVLSLHSDRVAVLNFHEYLEVNGNRATIGEEIFEKVVLPNANVRMVLCGHNYCAARRSDAVDDDGDGKADRTVYQLMANYQDTTNGGNGFMRFMECRPAEGVIVSSTYSPYTDEYGSDYETDEVMDVYGTCDAFTIPFDFSAPVPSEDSEAGVVVTEPAMVLDVTDEHGAIVQIPVAYQNEAMGEEPVGAGVYDRTFSADARDVSASPDTLTYVSVVYDRESEEYVIGKVLGGSEADDVIPMIQNGVVLAIPDGVTDLLGNVPQAAWFTQGRAVTLQGLTQTASPAAVKPTALSVSAVDAIYYVTAKNTALTDGACVVYDREWGEEVTAEETAVMFACTKSEDGQYTVCETASVTDTVAIPEGGIAVAIAVAKDDMRQADSLGRLFAKGRVLLLEQQREGVTEELLPASADGWKYNNNLMQAVDVDGGVAVGNTTAQGAVADVTFASPITMDPTDASLVYEVTAQSGAVVDLRLYCNNSSTTSQREEETLHLQTYIEGTQLQAGTNEMLGDDVTYGGEVRFADMALPADCYNADGTVTLKAFRVFAAGEPGTTVTLHRLAVQTNGNGWIWK